jgi:hypothetical protein
MRQALMASFREKDVASCYRIGKIEDDLNQAIADGKKLIVGHIDFSHLQKVKIPAEYKLLAMFRHPVDRIISTYLHFQKHDNPDYSTWKGGKVDFEDFMKSEFANNWYCQLMAGVKGLTPPQSSESKLYHEARDNFIKLDWVGLSDRFEDSLFSLSVFLGKRLKNPGRYNEGGQQEEFLKLKRRYEMPLLVQNPNDLLIYQSACKMLDIQLYEMRFKKLRRKVFNLRAGL